MAKPTIKDFLTHAFREQENPSDGFTVRASDHFDSRFEEDVCVRLRSMGLTVYTQVPCAGFKLDQVVMDQDGRRLAVECDGEFHYDDGDLRSEDYQRQDIIERAGWYVHRISFQRFYANPEVEIAKAIEALRQQPISSDEGDEGNNVTDEPAVEAISQLQDSDDLTDIHSTVATTETSTKSLESRIRIPKSPAPNNDSGRESDLHQGQEGDGERVVKQDEAWIEDNVTARHQPATSRPNKPQHPPSPPGFLSQGPTAKSRVWFDLSRWGKETAQLPPFDRKFAFTIGTGLVRGWEFTVRQQRYAYQVWKKATENGFTPPLDS